MAYRPHWAYNTPPDETRVWRYMKFKHFKQILNNGTLHFQRADRFNDQLEGSMPKALKEYQRESIEEHAKAGDLDVTPEEHERMYSAQFKRARMTAFVNCWTMNNYESTPMWGNYGNHEKSVAISTTIGDIKQALAEESHPVKVSQIYYVDFATSRDDFDERSERALSNALDRYQRHYYENLFLKNPTLMHEREVRLFATFRNPKASDPFKWKTIEALEGAPDGVLDRIPVETSYKVSVAPERLIENVHIPPDSPEKYVNEVKQSLDDSSINELDGDCVEPSNIGSCEPIF